jgi:hypothetical protein
VEFYIANLAGCVFRAWFSFVNLPFFMLVPVGLFVVLAV